MLIESGKGTSLAIVSVKAFGDVVIAVTSLARLEPGAEARVALLVGEHLLPLLASLSVRAAVRVIDHPFDGPAPLFDVRKRGWPAAIANGFSLYPAIARSVRPDETIVFDAMGIRERLLSVGRQATALPPADNIYSAYESLLRQEGLRQVPAGTLSATGPLVRIFAGARMVHRQIPLPVLRQTVDRVETRGGRAEIMLLEGERVDLEGQALPVTIVPRGFGNMLDAVRGADAVVSPDSMTAHLAEYCAKPVLVLTPAEKFYWMPRFAARTGAIALFADVAGRSPLDDFLDRFIAR